LRLPPAAVLILLPLLAPAPARAHNMFGEGNDFLNGLVHPLVSLPHALVMVALGLLVGQQKVKQELVSIFGYLAALVVGLVLATFSIGFAAERLLLAAALLLGLTLALDRPLPTSALLAAVTLGGLLMGLDFASETAESKAGLNLGTGVTLYFAFLAALGFAESFGKREWQRIALRVLGSWTAASALLALAFQILIPKD
jgi:urease accessory protein